MNALLELSTLEVIVWTLAAFRLTVLVVDDTFPPALALRAWILKRWPAEDTEYGPAVVTGDPESERWVVAGTDTEVIEVDDVTWVPLDPHWIGTLLTCAWCAGFWVGLLVIGAAAFGPSWAISGALPFALSAVIGLLSGWR